MTNHNQDKELEPRQLNNERLAAYHRESAERARVNYVAACEAMAKTLLSAAQSAKGDRPFVDGSLMTSSRVVDITRTAAEFDAWTAAAQMATP